MAATSTQGYTVRIDSESALGTADNGIDKDIRLAAAPTLPFATRQMQEQPNIGHENASDVSDKPIPYEAAQESAITLPIHIRRGATTSIPPLMYFLQSGGCTITDSAVDTVTAGAPAVDDFDATDSILGGTDTYGAAVLVETVANTTWYPSLLAKYDDAPDKQCVPVMDLPAIAAVGGDIIRMRTATVNPSVVGSTETLSISYAGRGDYTSAPDLGFTYAGCALADLGEISITRDGPVVLNPVFHCADADVLAETLNAASFLEGNGTDATTSQFQRQETSNFRFEIAPFAAAGGITYATLEMISATIRPNFTTIPMTGIGDSDALNGVQGYIQRVAPPECDVTVLVDHDYIDDASKGIEALTGNQFTYLGFVWATSDISNQPAVGIWLPKCYQYAPPDLDMFNDQYAKMTLHFRATSPAFTGGSTANGSTAMSPIYIAIHGND